MNITNKFTTNLKNVLSASIAIAKEFRHAQARPEHALFSLLIENGCLASEILHKEIAKAASKKKPAKNELASLLKSYIRPGNGTNEPKISKEFKEMVLRAITIAAACEHNFVGTEHLLYGISISKDKKIEEFFSGLNIKPEDIKKQVKSILKSTTKFQGINAALDHSLGSIDPSLPLDEIAGDSNLLLDGGSDPFNAPIDEELRADMLYDPFPENNILRPLLSKNGSKNNSGIKIFSRDLTELAKKGKIDPVIGRDEEISRLTQILCRRTKNNPILLGDPGVGKTAIVEGLAKKIVEMEVPEVLIGKRIMSLDLGSMVAGTIYRGEFEQRLKQVIDELQRSPDTILFIDELHTVIGAGANSGSLDAANILKPALARGDIRCIGATTFEEYRKHIENDPAFERRFQPVKVGEPDREEAIDILYGLKEYYEKYHRIEITDGAIEAAVDLSRRYMPERFLPDKAIDLIDETASKIKVKKSQTGTLKKIKRLEALRISLLEQKEEAILSEDYKKALAVRHQEKELRSAISSLDQKLKTEQLNILGSVTKEDISKTVSEITGIPEGNLTLKDSSESGKAILEIEKKINRLIIGQEEAVASLGKALRHSFAGLNMPQRPLASFMFLGPSGVGKTSLAAALANELFSDPKKLIRIDMSEFSESFNISKLIGAPAGYVGYKESGKLTESVKRNPYSIVLFDEIEKAHPDIFNLLLQILEDGKITDASGKEVNFKNTIIIMTSNIGNKGLKAGSIGFGGNESGREYIKEKLSSELKEKFPPEFLNRIDNIIVFNDLKRASIEKIIRLQIDSLNERLKNKNISLKLTREAIGHLCDMSCSSDQGARLVRKNIFDLIESPLAEKILAEDISPEKNLNIRLKDDKIIFH